jgi:hypothetical protein
MWSKVAAEDEKEKQWLVREQARFLMSWLNFKSTTKQCGTSCVINWREELTKMAMRRFLLSRGQHMKCGKRDAFPVVIYSAYIPNDIH